MEVINRLLIKNFRGIKELELPAKSINLIVGGNNTGKSSILEALSLIFCVTNDFSDSRGNNILSYLINKRNYGLHHILRDNINSSIEYTYGANTTELLLEYCEKGFPKLLNERIFLDHIFSQKEQIIKEKIIEKKRLKLFSHEISREFDEYLIGKEINFRDLSEEHLDSYYRDYVKILAEKEYQKEFNIYYQRKKIVITRYENGKLLSFYLVPGMSTKFNLRNQRTKEGDFEELILEPRESRKANKKHGKFSYIMSFQQDDLIDEINEFYDSIVERKKASTAMNIIKEGIPYFEDIRKTKKGLYVSLSERDKPLPLTSMGDGFISLIKLSFMISLVENSIIALEEPEVSQHPGFLDILAEGIVTNLDRVQFFITTHSLDLINYILKHGKRKNVLDNINIIKLHRGLDNTIDLEIIDGESAKDEVDNIHTDLRGA